MIHCGAQGSIWTSGWGHGCQERDGFQGNLVVQQEEEKEKKKERRYRGQQGYSLAGHWDSGRPWKFKGNTCRGLTNLQKKIKNSTNVKWRKDIHFKCIFRGLSGDRLSEISRQVIPEEVGGTMGGGPASQLTSLTLGREYCTGRDVRFDEVW